MCASKSDVLYHHTTGVPSSDKPACIYHTTRMNHFCILGIHPELSRAEFEEIHPQSETDLSERALLVESKIWEGERLMNRLGGTVKLGDIISSIPVHSLDATKLADMIEAAPRAKRVLFGLTMFGSKKIRADKLSKDLKRELKVRGHSVRWVTTKGDEPLSPAAVSKMKLTTDGYDFVVIEKNGIASIGLTTHVQDADAWSERDYGRPERDEKRGMLPPKLARIMVNLSRVPEGGAILDPFCGSGTILMEAALALPLKKIVGSDIDADQVRASQKNIEWLIREGIIQNFPLTKGEKKGVTVIQKDVRNLTEKDAGTFDAIVTEGHLGPLLRGSESEAMLRKNAGEIASLWREAFHALHPLLKKDGRIVCIWPAYETKNGRASGTVGRDRRATVDLSQDPAVTTHFRIENPQFLPYRRAGQHITRNIVILTKKGHP